MVFIDISDCLDLLPLECMNSVYGSSNKTVFKPKYGAKAYASKKESWREKERERERERDRERDRERERREREIKKREKEKRVKGCC